MIENTVFNSEELIDVVNKNYNIKVFQVEKINRGSANIYSLNEKKYILKEFQLKYSRKEIEREIAIINHLNKKNIAVPEYIRTIQGEYYFTYKDRIIIMQKFIDGYTMESNTGNYNQMIESAEKLGQIIEALKDLEVEIPMSDVSSWYSTEIINESIEKQTKLLSKISEGEYPQIYKDLLDKIKMLKYIRDNMEFSDMKKLTIMNTHGDYSVLQFIYKDEKINAIIDFVSACKMPIVWEVIRSYSYIDSEVKDGRINLNNLVDYVRSFSKYVPLNKYDIKYMAYLYLIQLLSSTFGYKQYINDNSNKSLLEFAFFRTKLCRNLYDNAENISNALKNGLRNE
ncbi:MAG: phosphotransferase [Clostridia bacterium]|nr:phosphotransferase [Clostridia bacterium]